MEPTGGDEYSPRALLTVAGRTVLQHQLELALALGCRRIVCVTAGSRATELAGLRQQVEQAGATFHLLYGPEGLQALVGANDELLVFADGVLVEPHAALKLLEPGEGVLVQPVEEGLAAGFERLDLNRATGGLMLAPAKLVARLAELPPDYDAISALTRIALQAGVPMREIPDAARRGGRWTVVRDEAEALRLENRWIALNLGEDPDATPSQMLARLTIGAYGSSLLHAGSSSRMLALGTGILLLAALGAGWFGASATGFVLTALACFLGQGAMMLMRVEQGALEPKGPITALGGALLGLIDAVLVLLVAWPAAPYGEASLLARFFPPLMLVGMLRLVGQLFSRRRARWLHDRAMVSAILAVGALGGFATGFAQIGSLGLAAGGILQRALGSRRRPDADPLADEVER